MAVTGSYVLTPSDLGGGITKYNIVWTSDASAGSVTDTPFAMKRGTIVTVEILSNTGGTAPTTAYDIDLVDAESVSLFDDGSGTSIGANITVPGSYHKVPFVGGGSVTYVRRWHHGGDVTPSITNAGNSKGGTVNIYVIDGLL